MDGSKLEDQLALSVGLQSTKGSVKGAVLSASFLVDIEVFPSVVGAWGAGPTFFNPGGFDPVLFARKWLGSGADNLTKVRGTHTMKFGAYWEMVTNNQPGNNNSNGFIELATWSGNSSGNILADLLLGRGNSYNESTKNAIPSNKKWGKERCWSLLTWGIRANTS